MARQYASSIVQKLPAACLVDIVPPTFAGIATLIANANGSIKATWLAGIDLISNPVRYNIYIQKSSFAASTLFNSTNLKLTSLKLTEDIYANFDGEILLPGVSYRVGVRAVDAVGNESQNTQYLEVVSLGVLSDALSVIALQIYQASLSINASVSAIAGGPEMEVEPDPEIELENQPDPELDVDVDEC